MHKLARLWWVLVLVMLLLATHGVAGARPAGATITVDTENDSNLPDNELSLREAIGLANGDRSGCFTTHEKNQVSGANWVMAPPWPSCGGDISTYPRWNLNAANPGVGLDYADHIVFGGSVGTITLGSVLPNVGKNDNIDGSGGAYGGKVRLDGSGLGSGNGITVHVDCTDCPATANQILNLVLEGFPGDGVNIAGQAANGVVLQGLEIYGSNNGIYIATGGIHNSRNMQIGGASAGQRNVIYCNNSNGIYLTGTNSADFGSDFGNTIQNNYIGVKSDGKTKCANAAHGILLYNMRGNTISGNVLSGNGGDGLNLQGQGSINNLVVSNSIGSDVSGTVKIGNVFNGITLSGNANNNQIGASSQANLIIGNGLTGIALYNSGTTGNTIAYNIVGPGGGNAGGIRIVQGASRNTLQQNWIGSNTTFGVLIDGSGTLSNTLSGNKIGTDYGGTSALANGTNGVQIENGASENVVGPGNVISGNGNDGVQISGGGTIYNEVYSNTIGLSASGTYSLPNGYSGVSIFGGASNTLVGISSGGNVIAGNGRYGIYIADFGTSSNQVYANTIGTNLVGAGGLGNRYDGIGIYNGAAYNAVGSISTPAWANVIAGNAGVGIAIGDAGTTGNTVFGNAIGWFDVFTPRPNDMGVRLTGGATYNTISGNYIAGNTTQGVGLYNSGTTSNTVYANIIGGTVLSALGNGQNGVVIQESASANSIDQNTIVSNGQNGVYINSSGTMSNVISNNRIGTNSGGSGLGNGGSGIFFDSGATNNTVLSGTIAYNGGAGIAAAPGSSRNTFLRLNEYSNAGLGIDLLDPAGVGCTDGAAGGNHCVAPPVISDATATQVRGSASVAGARIDVYVVDADPSGYGEGRYWLKSVTTDGAGKWKIVPDVDLCTTYGSTAKVSATLSVDASGTSEFAQNVPACHKLFLPLVQR